jgi:hypothetical protein
MLPLIFLIAVFGLALLAGGRSYFNWRAGTGDVCKSTGPVTAVGDQPIPVTAPFEIRKLCWASGYGVEKGRKYRIWIDAKDDPWFDRTIMSGVNGFQLYSRSHIKALPLRRLYTAAWFQPVLRIGAEGDSELPLQAINVMPADDLPRLRNPIDRANEEKQPVRVDETTEFAADNELRSKWPKSDDFERIPDAALPAVREIWRKQGLADLMVADFVAPESGEVFLYVNDAIQVLPFFGPLDRFYNNNSGTAKVTLQRMPPPPPQAKGTVPEPK